jgi:putative FmdB family regulatory protein
MPIYVYLCGRCRERFERLVPMSANSATAICPNCGAEDARKQLVSFATLDKGASGGGNASACAPSGG